MLINQISPNDPISAMAVEAFLKNAKILKDAQFYLKSGDSATVKKARKGTQTDIFRDINTEKNATPPENEYPATPKKIVSITASVDVVLEDRNEDVDAELITETRAQCEEAAFVLQEKFFEGNKATVTKEFDGFRKLVPAANKKETDVNGTQLVLGNSDTARKAQQKAIEKMLMFFASVRGGATHAYMNEFLSIRLLLIAKELGLYKEKLDELGNKIELIGNTAIKSAGQKTDGSLLLPFDETVGTSTDCSSIIACRWGERTDLTCVTSAGIKGRYIGQDGRQLKNSIDLDMAIQLQNDTALWQSTGWRLG